MFLRISSDANEESEVGRVLADISGATRRHFLAKDYGIGLLGVVVVLMCRNPALNFKRRVRFSKREKMIFMDVMLDLNEMRRAQHEGRKRAITERLADEVPTVIHGYSIGDFDEPRFAEDLKGWLSGIT
jgi:hypothetical protein